MTSILLLSATEAESGPLVELIEESSSVDGVQGPTIEGTLAGQSCRLVHTGIGTVNTAVALTRELERRRPRLVVQFGIGGAYVPANVPVGAVACASEEIYGDLGVLTPEGPEPLEAIGISLVPGEPPRFNRFPLDRELVERAAATCGATVGPFVTVGRCTGVRAVGDTYHSRFSAICESMEGAAAAHVCALYGVPFLELRGISNLVEDRDRSRWRIEEAVNAATEAVIRLVQRIDCVLEG